MAYESEQSRRFMSAITNDIKKQTLRMKLVQMELEKKDRLKALRERARKALIAVQHDQDMPLMYKAMMESAEIAIVDEKDMVSGQMILANIKKLMKQ